MNRIKKTIAIMLTMLFVIGSFSPTYAASGKTVYVLTSVRDVYEGDGGTFSTTLKYDKNGFLKTTKYITADKYTTKSNFTYNKSKQATKATFTEYKHSVKTDSGKALYNYSKKGHLTKARTFYVEKRRNKTVYVLYNAAYYTWDKRGNLIREHYYDEEDETEHIERFKYKGGKLMSSSGKDIEEDEMGFKKTFTYKKNKCTMKYMRKEPTTDIDEDGNEFERMEWVPYSTTVITYKNKQPVKEAVYLDQDDTANRKTTYKYKKITVPKRYYSKVMKQQKVIHELIDDSYLDS